MKKLLIGLTLLTSTSSFAVENCPLSIRYVNDALKEAIDTELSWTAKRTLSQKYNLNNSDSYPRLEVTNYCQQEDYCWTIANVISRNENGNLYISESVSADGERVIESAIENGIEAAVQKLGGCI